MAVQVSDNESTKDLQGQVCSGVGGGAVFPCGHFHPVIPVYKSHFTIYPIC